MKKNGKKILLSGGGTGGSVTPLLALTDMMRALDPSCGFIWVGTKTGPEKQMVEKEGIRFISIFCGKLRRYFSWRNFVDPAFIVAAFFQALHILWKEKPDLVMSAGGFVSVPLLWASWLCRIPSLIHQQDARAGLANKLMAPFATAVTVTFEKSLSDYGRKAVWTGNPVRTLLQDLKMTKREAVQKLGFDVNRPVVFVLGGGTGSAAINALVEESLVELLKFAQLVHIAGKNVDDIGRFKALEQANAGYRVFEFLDITGMLKAFTAAELAVSRCGMGVLTELSALGKAAILIPMPDSHQEDNAVIFERAGAALVLEQKVLTSKKFIQAIREMLEDQARCLGYAKKIKSIIKTDMRDFIEVLNKLL